MDYPTLYISDIDEPLGLPSEGEAVIKFKIRRKTEVTKKGDDPKYSYDLDVLEIYPKKKKKAPGESLFKNTEEALDEIKTEYED